VRNDIPASYPLPEKERGGSKGRRRGERKGGRIVLFKKEERFVDYQLQ